MRIASILIADENLGRRNLLANTFEREGYEVTRLSTLSQTEATAVVVLPDVVLLEGEWSQGSALDACQKMSSQPKFRGATRVVVLSRTTAPDFLSSAAASGVSEVIGKPVDMNHLVAQIGRHASKQFVPPPAELAPQGSVGAFSGQRFDVGMTMNDSQWALPMLRRLVEAGNIDDDFVASVQEEMEAQSGEAMMEENGLSSEALTTLVRLSLNRLVGTEGSAIQAPPQDEVNPAGVAGTEAPTFNSLSKGTTLGQGAQPAAGSGALGSSMEDILERQAEDIARQVEGDMEGILSEQPNYIALLEDDERIPIDPETLELTRLTSQVVHELMNALQRPGSLSDLTLLTQIEDASRMTQDVLDALPAREEEE